MASGNSGRASDRTVKLTAEMLADAGAHAARVGLDESNSALEWARVMLARMRLVNGAGGFVVHPSHLTDVVTLLENERDELRAEVEHLRGELDAARAEVERLRRVARIALDRLSGVALSLPAEPAASELRAVEMLRAEVERLTRESP